VPRAYLSGRGLPPIPLDRLCPLELRRARAAGRRLDPGPARAALARCWWALDRIGPAMVVPWNGHTGHVANALRLYKVRHGLPGGFTERGPAPGSVFFDEEGVNGAAGLARTAPGPEAGRDGDGGEVRDPEAAVPHLRPLARRLARSGPGGGAGAVGGAGAGARSLFVPLQVQDDSNIVLHGGRIRTMRALVRAALELAGHLGPDWRVVARPHPEEDPEARLELPRDPRLTVDRTTPLEEAVAASPVCLTVNSTVGLEAALDGALVVCLGEGLYCRQPFVLPAQERPLGEVAREIRRRLDAPEDRRPALRAFLAALEARHQIGHAEAGWHGTAGGDGDGDGDGDGPARTWTDAATPPRAGGTTAPGRLAQWRRMARAAAAAPAVPSATPGPGPVVRSPGMARAGRRLAALRGRAVAVDVHLSPSDRMFLTYRLTEERPTAAILRAILARRGLRVAALRRAGAAGAGSGAAADPGAGTGAGLPRVAILSSASERRLEGYDLVLDEYGAPHCATYLGAAASWRPGQIEARLRARYGALRLWAYRARRGWTGR
jgi:hypothetical protein